MPPPRPGLLRVWVAALAAALSTTALLGVIPSGDVAAASVGSTSVAVRQPGATAAVALAPGWRREMLARVNAVRAAVGVGPLRPCPSLRRAAQGYATVMSARDHYGHVGPDGSQPADRIRREGYVWRAVAENIAAGLVTVDAVMTAWAASPSHYANLVDPDYRHVGFGYGGSDTGTYGSYWVQDFGRGRGC